MGARTAVRPLRIGLVAALLLTGGCGGSAEPPASPTAASSAAGVETRLGQLATDLIAALVAEDFEAAVAHFDDRMRQALPAADLAAAWRQVTDQAGPYESELGRRQENTGGYRAVVVTAQFERSPVDVRVVFDADRRIAGLFFQPASGASAAPSAQAWQPPAYSDPARLTRTDVTIGDDEWQLPGTLTTPESGARWPAVVLVHGSGPNDRDETIGPNKPFRDLALGLASRGIAVLAYDKRTLTHAAAMASIADLTVEQEVVADAVRAVALLRTTGGVAHERVFVLGHSLGGMLAPRIATQAEGVAGLVIVAGAARPLQDLVLEQQRYLAERDGMTDQERDALARVAEQVATIEDPALDPETPAAQLLGAPASYWLDLRSYHPTDVAAAVNLPMLVLQGEHDYQVTMADFALWRRALSGRGDVTFSSYPGLNHLMMTAPADPAASSPSAGALGGPEEYEVPGHVDVEVIDEIARFVLAPT